MEKVQDFYQNYSNTKFSSSTQSIRYRIFIKQFLIQYIVFDDLQ